MKQAIAEFIKGATKPEQFPKTAMPEIAFSGRSNVGKSSVLNSLVNRKNLARISSTPGKTREINFYIINKKYIIADLPGFGYASVSKTEREQWLKLNLEYLEKRENLRLICLLVDGRHEPMETDIKLMEFLENSGRRFLVILTKCDKISQTLIEERKKQFEFLLQNCSHCLEVLPYSSKSGLGREILFGIISKNLRD